MEKKQPVLNPGDRIGKYIILSLLGKGVLATVYLAEHQITRRKVALKLFETQDDGLLALAHREAEMLANIDHPYIVRMYDADEYEGWFYLVVEYVNGKTLANMIAAEDRVPIKVVLQLMIDIAEALEYAHHLGVVHGNIKPANILVSPKGVPILTDFFPFASVGIQAFYEAESGTPIYLSPESWQGKYEPRSDLWSLGMTFHHLLTGQFPFDVKDEKAISQSILSDEPLDLSLLYNTVPDPVAHILERCMQKSLDQRYQSAAELCRDGKAALDYLELRESDKGAGSGKPLYPGITIMLNVEYKEPGIAGQYREYRIGNELGQGSFSHVYQAEDVIGSRQVALKILRQERIDDERIIFRFRREAGLLARLDHPHIVRVYNYGQYARNYFLVMEVLAGLTLGQALEAKRTFRVEEAVAILSQILAGLEKLHAENVVHRDLKPDNIKLLPDRVVVMDLGIAHISTETLLTRSGEVFGTPRYMSPEQARGEKTNFQSDLYTSGVILYELLTGKIPHESDSMARLIFKIALEEPTPITNYRQDLPASLVAFLGQMLAKEPAGRFSSTPLAHDALLASVGLQRSEVPAIYAAMIQNIISRREREVRNE